MKLEIARALVLSGALVAIASLSSAPAWAADDDPGLTRGFFATPIGFNAERLDPEFRNVQTLSLPPGRYIANAAAAFGISGNPDFALVECVFMISGAIQGELSRGTFGGASNNFITLPLTVGFTLRTPQDLTVACRSDAGVVTQPTVITAIRVDRLTVQGTTQPQ